ncbi:MAG: sulfurtransferase [Candidatus Eisenbacteria bacterium]|nr:sulfurtransferase [Candidatus Eisenbacteria bacterium]
MEHSPGFLALVDAAKRGIREITIDEYRDRASHGEKFLLVDVREDLEWLAGRIPGAAHLGKGLVERDIEKSFPDKDAPLVFYCGGGFRSALVCDSVQKMGYRNVTSLAGGYHGWEDAGHPLDTRPPRDE